MPGLPFKVSPDTSHPAMVRLSTFFKVATGVSEGTALLLLDGASAGRLLAFLDATGLVSVLGTYRGVDVAVALNPSSLVAPGTWYWLSVVMGSHFTAPNSNALIVGGQLWSEAGLTDGFQFGGGPTTSTPGGGFPELLSWPFGWGCNLTQPIASFPKSVGNELAVGVVESNQHAHGADQGGLTMPLTDPTASALATATGSVGDAVGIYLCHESIGATDVIHDSSGNAYDLSPGPNGFVVVADGPY